MASQWLRKPTMAIALTFVQAVLLSRAALFELLPEFPSAYRVIRRAAYILALRRYIVTAAEALRTQQATAASDDPRSKPVASWSQVKAVSRVVGSMANGPSADAPSVNDALAAMREKQKEVEDNLSKASRASALLLAPVEVAPFQGVSSLGNGRLGRRSSKPNSAVNVEEEDAANMVEHTAALASLKQQVGGVDLKLDALQKQMEALTVAARQKSFGSRQRVGAYPRSRLPDARAGNPPAASASASGAPLAGRIEEMQELRDAEGMQSNTALRSTPFEA